MDNSQETKDIPMMPSEYAGEFLMHTGGGSDSQHRRWTKEEIKWMNDMFDKGYSRVDVAFSMRRTETSVALKHKRINKRSGDYNKWHIREKYEINDKFLDEVKPSSLLDLYAGNSFYKDKGIETLVTNDKNKTMDTDYHKDALKLICELYSKGKKFDVIDLDPFGSAYDCFDLAVKMAQKGLIITLGELGHKRWKRFDFVRSHYGISTLDDFTIDNIVSKIQEIGKRNKKDLVVVDQREWPNIGRVWFKIQPYKITEQWSKND